MYFWSREALYCTNDLAWTTVRPIHHLWDDPSSRPQWFPFWGNYPTSFRFDGCLLPTAADQSSPRRSYQFLGALNVYFGWLSCQRPDDLQTCLANQTQWDCCFSLKRKSLWKLHSQCWCWVNVTESCNFAPSVERTTSQKNPGLSAWILVSLPTSMEPTLIDKTMYDAFTALSSSPLPCCISFEDLNYFHSCLWQFLFLLNPVCVSLVSTSAVHPSNHQANLKLNSAEYEMGMFPLSDVEQVKMA